MKRWVKIMLVFATALSLAMGISLMTVGCSNPTAPTQVQPKWNYDTTGVQP